MLISWDWGRTEFAFLDSSCFGEKIISVDIIKCGKYVYNRKDVFPNGRQDKGVSCDLQSGGSKDFMLMLFLNIDKFSVSIPAHQVVLDKIAGDLTKRISKYGLKGSKTEKQITDRLKDEFVYVGELSNDQAQSALDLVKELKTNNLIVIRWGENCVIKLEEIISKTSKVHHQRSEM